MNEDRLMSEDDYKKEIFSHKYLKEKTKQDGKSFLAEFLKKKEILQPKMMLSTDTYYAFLESDFMENVCDKLQQALIT
jgi:hypothetical protein